MSVDRGLLTVDLDVAVGLGGLDLGGGGDLALDGSHHGGVVVILTANTGQRCR